LRLFLAIVCFMVIVGHTAMARGTYHRSEPYVDHTSTDKHKTHSWAPVIVYSPAHGHYHKTYHPDQPD
jgi:hypothetical protein